MTPEVKEPPDNDVAAAGPTDELSEEQSRDLPEQQQQLTPPRPRLRLILGGAHPKIRLHRRPKPPIVRHQPPEPAPRHISKFEHWKLLYVPNPPRQLVVEPLGLCATCAKRSSCEVAALPGGIWSCDEFA